MVAGTWSGTFTNESFEGPGIYQAKNGVRCFVDMRTTPGAVTIAAPDSPDEHSSFIVSVDNPGRADLVFAADETFENPLSVEREIVQSPAVNFRHFTVGFTFTAGTWEIFDWALLGVTIGTNFAIAWEGRSTNGLCNLVGSFKGFEVERTSTGFYTVRLIPGAILTPQLLIKTPFATGLPADNSPELLIKDLGMAIPDEIVVNSGLRNKGGVFLDNDLLQDPANFMAVIGQQFP